MLFKITKSYFFEALNDCLFQKKAHLFGTAKHRIPFYDLKIVFLPLFSYSLVA